MDVYLLLHLPSTINYVVSPDRRGGREKNALIKPCVLCLCGEALNSGSDILIVGLDHTFS